MSMFGNIDDLPTGSARIFFLPGVYKVRVDAVKAIDAAASQQNKNSFIVECTILESNNSARPAGSTASWVQSIKPENPRQAKLALQSVKQFLAAALGDMAYFDKPGEDGKVPSATEVAQLASSEANPFANVVLGLTCTPKPMRNTPGDFTRHDWYPAEAA